ncbi:MAG: hypothetical protein AAFO69_04655, partial [Bacteroidota bacterium]
MKPLSAISTLIMLLLIICSLEKLSAQTGIAVSSTRVNFSEIDRKVDKLKNKEWKRKEKAKSKKIKEMGRFIDKNTNLSDHEIAKYQSYLWVMDSVDLARFEEELMSHEALADPKFEKSKKYIKQAKSEFQKTRQDSSTVQNAKKQMLLKLAREEYGAESEALKASIDDMTPAAIDSLLQKLGGAQIDLDSLKLKDLDSLIANRVTQVKDTVSELNWHSLSSNEQIVSKLEQMVARQVSNSELEKMQTIDPMAEVTAPVQEYIPELEKFDFKKPEIPEEQLKDAMAQQLKERKLDELTKDLSLKDQDNFKEKE